MTYRYVLGHPLSVLIVTVGISLCVVGAYGMAVDEVYYGACPGCVLYNAPSCWGTDAPCSGASCAGVGQQCQSGRKDYHSLKNCREVDDDATGVSCQNSDEEDCYTTYDCSCVRVLGWDNDHCSKAINIVDHQATVQDCI